MSSPSPEKGKKPGPPPRQQKPDMDPVELMRAMGGNGWFNPQSNDMIRALRHLAKTQSLPRPIVVMFAWMVWHTTTRDNRQPYANRQGIMLYLKDLADECGIELHNCRMYWRKGVELGIWRNGDGEKGENTEGLYLCGKVAALDEVEAPGEPQKGYVHTPKELFLQRFKPYIREQLEQLQPESFQHFAVEWDQLDTVDDSVHADLAAAGRKVVGQLKDTLLRRVGIEQKRLDTAKNKSPEELEEAAIRQARIEKLLLSHVSEYVQTLRECVPTPDPSLYTPKSEAVQTNGNGAKNGAGNGAISPANQPLADESAATPEKPSTYLERVRTTDPLLRAGGSKGPAATSGASRFNEGKKSGQLPAVESRILDSLADEEYAAAMGLLLTIAQLQRKHPRRFAGEVVSPENRGDLAWAAKAVRAVGLNRVQEFGQYIEQRATMNALGHAVTIAIMTAWPGDFHRAAAEQEQQRRAIENAERARKQREETARQLIERENAICESAAAAWAGFTDEERARRLSVAEQLLKADPRWNKQWRDNPTSRKQRVQAEAIRALRVEIEKAAQRAAGGDV